VQVRLYLYSVNELPNGVRLPVWC